MSDEVEKEEESPVPTRAELSEEDLQQVSGGTESLQKAQQKVA